MSWKFVYNSNLNIHANTLKDVADAALAAGYKFFIFNSEVHFVFIADKGLQHTVTGIMVSDLY